MSGPDRWSSRLTWLDRPTIGFAARLALVSAFLVSGVMKSLDFASAVEEVRLLTGLEPASLVAASVVLTQLGGSALVLAGGRWTVAGALLLATFTIVATLAAHADEWQWIDSVPKIRLLAGEVQRDRWLTREEAQRLIDCCAPHLAALVRFALATGCRAREITGLEWARVDLTRKTAWLDRTKNGTPRGVPLNSDAIAVLEAERGKHPHYCFTFRGEPIGWDVTNTAWLTALRKAQITDFRFHDLRHTWASWHRQAGTSCDELKDLGGWKSRSMVDRYAKFATENLLVAATRIELNRDQNVINLSRFRHGRGKRRVSATRQAVE